MRTTDEKKLHNDFNMLIIAREDVNYRENKLNELRQTDVRGFSVKDLVKLEIKAGVAEKMVMEASNAYAKALGKFVDTYGDDGVTLLFGGERNNEPIDPVSVPSEEG